jgi:hypothetical protein
VSIRVHPWFQLLFSGESLNRGVLAKATKLQGAGRMKNG